MSVHRTRAGFFLVSLMIPLSLLASFMMVFSVPMSDHTPLNLPSVCRTVNSPSVKASMHDFLRKPSHVQKVDRHPAGIVGVVGDEQQWQHGFSVM